MPQKSQAPENLTLDQLRKGVAFRVLTDFDGTEGRLLSSDLYRIAAAMADSGKTCVVEHCGGPDCAIRIPRAEARTIPVFMVRQTG